MIYYYYYYIRAAISSTCQLLLHTVVCVCARPRICCATGVDEEMSAPVHDDVPETGPGPADRPAGHGPCLSASPRRVTRPSFGRQPDDGHRRSPSPTEPTPSAAPPSQRHTS